MSGRQDDRVPALANRGGRVTYFDVAKGISILLVAFFHTTLGFVSADILDNSPVLNFLTTVAYAFHVHIFFAISGYFAVRAVNRVGSLRTKMLSLYYPYLVWSVLSLVASGAAAHTTNSHYSWHAFLSIPFQPVLQYWFLLSLMVCIALLYVVRTRMALIVSAAVALPASMVLPGWLHDTAYFYPFAVIGALFAMQGSLPILKARTAILCFCLLNAGSYLGVATGASGMAIRSAIFIPLSLTGCYALLYVSQAIAAHRAGRVLAFLGESSLAIYLVHVMVAASLRIVLYKVDPAFNVFGGVAICFAASIGLSLTVKELAHRLGLSKLAGFEPFVLGSRAVRTTSSAQGRAYGPGW